MLELRPLLAHRGGRVRLKADRTGASSGMLFAQTSQGEFFVGGTQRPEDAMMLVAAFNLTAEVLEAIREE